MQFELSIPDYIARVDRVLDATLPRTGILPVRLHEAMRYATLNGGKRMRPLLVYATGEVLGLSPDVLDAPAVAVELIHAFSLVHDDLPAMDDDDLRRGRPTVHRQYDEATAILAADAMQPLAFEVLACAPGEPARQLALINILSRACGSLGMTGGQAIDIESEGKRIDEPLLRQMYSLKTGALISAAVEMSVALATNLGEDDALRLAEYARCLGLAFQIRDDILDVEGETLVIGKPAGSDVAQDKATWPALFGMVEAKRQCEALYTQGLAALDVFGANADPLRVLARNIVRRED